MATRAASSRNVRRDSDTATDDRRKHVRIAHKANFSLRPLLPDGVAAPIAVVLADLSTSGLGVLHSVPLRVGDQFQIPLTRELPEPLTLICTCVRCEKLDEDLYSIGFEFNSSAKAVDEGSRQLTGKPVRRN